VAAMGNPFYFRVNVTDNIGIAKVVVNITFPSRAQTAVLMHLGTISGKGNGTYWYEVHPPIVRGELSYFFNVTDLSGNSCVTSPMTIAIHDDDSPRFGTDQTSGPATKGLEFSFRVDVTDNIDRPEVYLEYWFDDGAHMNKSMAAWRWTEDNIFKFIKGEMMPRHIDGPLFYFFSANDSSGNWARTEVKSIQLVNRPPVLVADMTWNVTEGQEATLAIEPLLSDGNDAVANLTLSILSGNARQEGLSLRVNHSSWVPDYRIAISVSDGEDTAFGNITVHVTNVNDPPIISGVSPGSNSTFKQDDAIAFSVNATDEDNDTLEYAWTIDGSMLRKEKAFTFDGLHPGRHEVVVTVSDGESTASSRITVIVKETKESVVGGGAFLYLLIALLLIAVIGICLVLRQRQKGSKATPPPAAVPARKP